MADEAGDKKKGIWWVLGLCLAVVVPSVLSVLFWRTTPVVGGWSDKGTRSEGAAAPGAYAPLGPVAAGQSNSSPEEVYRVNCARCHGAELEGTGAIPALKRANWPYRKNRDLLVRIIHQGRGLTMPGYEGKLSNQQIEALADFVQAANAAAAP